MEPYKSLLRAVATSFTAGVAICIILVAAFIALSWAGWHYTALTVFAWLFAVVFAVLVSEFLFSEFLFYDLFYCLRRANEKLKKDRATKKGLHRAALSIIAEDVERTIGLGLIGYGCFVLSVVAWTTAAPEVFNQPASTFEVIVYIVDLWPAPHLDTRI